MIERNIFSDERGLFLNIFNSEIQEKLFGNDKLLQVNLSQTNKKGAIRGFHFQFGKFIESKLVTCIKGKVFDVAIDLRKNSDTFAQWFAVELSQTNNKSLFIPNGCAHGFQSLEANCQIIYCHSKTYSQKCEAGVHVFDKDLNIPWPLNCTSLSSRDQSLRPLSDFRGSCHEL